MKATMDAAGRLVIPSAIRKAAGLRAGEPLDVRYRDGRIEIEPAPVEVQLERRGRLLVAVPRTAHEELTEEQVERTRDELQGERGRS